MGYSEDFDDEFDDNDDFSDDSDYSPETPEPGWDGTSEPDLDQFETFAEYDDARAEFRTTRAVEKALQKGQQPQGADELTPWQDDPHQADRAEAQEWLEHCREQQEAAEATGDGENAQLWRERARMTRDELAELPETPKEQFIKKTKTGFETAVLNKELFAAENPKWGNQRLRDDASVVLSRSNSKAESTLMLPLEESPWGDILPCRPANMVKVQLDSDQMAEFQRSVYHAGTSNHPDDVFKRSWDFLRQIGVDTTATRNPYASGGSESASADLGPGVDRMIQAGEESYSDFKDVVTRRDLPFTETLLSAALSVENAADVVYHLAKDPDRARQISEMGADQAREAVSRISARLSGRKPGSRISDVSRAAPPTGSETYGATVVTRDPDSMSQKDYEAWRNSGGGR